jgi:hypothetical protein
MLSSPEMIGEVSGSGHYLSVWQSSKLQTSLLLAEM